MKTGIKRMMKKTRVMMIITVTIKSNISEASNSKGLEKREARRTPE
jgi:hypothetical protein